IIQVKNPPTATIGIISASTPSIDQALGLGSAASRCCANNRSAKSTRSSSSARRCASASNSSDCSSDRGSRGLAAFKNRFASAGTTMTAKSGPPTTAAIVKKSSIPWPMLARLPSRLRQQPLSEIHPLRKVGDLLPHLLQLAEDLVAVFLLQRRPPVLAGDALGNRRGHRTQHPERA